MSIDAIIANRHLVVLGGVFVYFQLSTSRSTWRKTADCPRGPRVDAVAYRSWSTSDPWRITLRPIHDELLDRRGRAWRCLRPSRNTTLAFTASTATTVFWLQLQRLSKRFQKDTPSSDYGKAAAVAVADTKRLTSEYYTSPTLLLSGTRKTLGYYRWLIVNYWWDCRSAPSLSYPSTDSVVFLSSYLQGAVWKSIFFGLSECCPYRI